MPPPPLHTSRSQNDPERLPGAPVPIDALHPRLRQVRKRLDQDRHAHAWGRWAWWGRRATDRQILATAWVETLKQSRRDPQPVVLDWLAAVGDPTWSTATGATPLMAALHYAEEDVAWRTLLQADPDGRRAFDAMIPGDGAPVHSDRPDKVHPMAVAASRGFERIVARLLPWHLHDQGLLDGTLGSAAMGNHPSIVARLLPLVHRPSGEWLREAVARGYDEITGLLLDRVGTMTPDRRGDSALLVALRTAVTHGHLLTLRRLMGLADPSVYVHTDLLEEAARMGRVDCLRELLPTMDPQARNVAGWTPLLAAAASDHNTLDVIDVLLPLSDLSVQVEVGGVFDVAAAVASFGQNVVAHLWARVDRLAFVEPDQDKVNAVFQRAGPALMPHWAIRHEQAELRAVLDDEAPAPASPARRPRL